LPSGDRPDRLAPARTAAFSRSAARLPPGDRPDRLAPSQTAAGRSWDRLHIVGLARVQGFNRINRNLGYQELTIATPTRYRAAQAGTP
jgi:hypothetical protein